MFKLWGSNEVEQYEYLKVRVIVSVIIVVLGILAGIFIRPALGIVALTAYYWGAGFFRKFTGGVSLLAFLTQNIIFGTIIIVLFLVVGYLVGIIVLAAAIFRFIYLAVKSKQPGGLAG